MIHALTRDVQVFTSNVFLVDGARAVLVDAGGNFDVVSKVREHVDALDAVVLTHTHPDHVANVPALREALDVETWGYDPSHDAVDNPLADGERVHLGDEEYVALHTPGHKDDHLVFYAPATGVLFAGDLVFENGGFGRTDLPEGDRETLIRSIDRVRERVDTLSALYPGHGPSVTVDPDSTLELAARAARMG